MNNGFADRRLGPLGYVAVPADSLSKTPWHKNELLHELVRIRRSRLFAGGLKIDLAAHMEQIHPIRVIPFFVLGKHLGRFTGG